MHFLLKTVLLLLVCMYSVAYAQVEKIDTDRPDQTESPFTIPKKWVQLEMGFNKQQNDRQSNEYYLPTLLSKYGLTKKIELRLITTLISTPVAGSTGGSKYLTGLEPVEIGGKIALLEEHKLLPKTSLLFHVAIPTLASKAYRAHHLAPNFRFSMQHSLTQTVGLGYNLGAEWDGFTNKPTWIYTLAPGFNLGEKWYAYAELFGFIARQENAQHSFDGGFAYYPNPNFKIDLSGGFGISESAPDWYVALGASIRFKTGK